LTSLRGTKLPLFTIDKDLLYIPAKYESSTDQESISTQYKKKRKKKKENEEKNQTQVR